MSQFNPVQAGLLGAGLAFGLLLTGCDSGIDTVDPQGGPPTYGPSSVGAGGNQGGTPLLDLLMSKPENILHQGVRRVTLAGEFEPLVFTEELTCDGDGGFYLEPLQVISGHHDPDLFLLLESGRAPFAFRYRDFRVEDPQRFQGTYLVSEQGAGSVAGIATVRLSVVRRQGGATTWAVDIDPSTGLILAAEEWNGAESLSRMEYLSLDLQPDLTGLPIGQHRYERSNLDPSVDLANQLGYKVLVPSLLPAGFQQDEVAIMSPTPGTPEDKWIRIEYGDGLNRVVFLQRRQNPALLYNGSSKGTIRVDQIGAWVIVTGTLDAHEIVLAGKVPEQNLLEMLQSGL